MKANLFLSAALLFAFWFAAGCSKGDPKWYGGSGEIPARDVARLEQIFEENAAQEATGLIPDAVFEPPDVSRWKKAERKSLGKDDGFKLEY